MSQQLPGLMVDHSSNDARIAHRLDSIDLHGIDISSLDARDVYVGALASSTPLPASPDDREREANKSFFGNRGASPSAGRAREEASASTAPASMDVSEGSRSRSTSIWRPTDTKVAGTSSVGSDHDGNRSPDAVPPPRLVPRSTSYDDSSNISKGDDDDDDDSTLPLASFVNAAEPLPPTAAGARTAQADGKKANKKRLQVLSRSKSLRVEDEMSRFAKSTAKKANGHQAPPGAVSEPSSSRSFPPVPPEKDRSFRDMMKTSLRDRSEDRLADSDEDRSSKPRHKRENTKSKHVKDTKERQAKELKEKPSQPRPGHPLSSSLRQHNTSTFFNEFRHTSSNAAIGLGKAGKGFLSKFSRSGSGTEKVTAPVADHVPGVLTLPLIEQTRITRIAKSYDHCKDKTEFWMPALPWRCIDYLNGKCEEEGLYRVSGGLIQVKEWRKRFDTELDVNLLDETDLYDASIIASLFKEWIRELPEEIFPKDIQDQIVAQLPRELPQRGFVPALLRDELQKLPPFNYYLLFAITCHLSLLLSYEQKNRMTLENLYRCFNQSLKLDGRIFYTLVGDWRQCWAGCLTENDYLRAEYDYLQHPYPQFIRESDENLAAQADERAISSSGSSVLPATGVFTPEMQRPATSHTQPSQSGGDGEEFYLSPTKKSHRSSSDVTGMSPMKAAFNTAPRGSS